MNDYDQRKAEYEELEQTPEGKQAMEHATKPKEWKALPVPPVAPAFDLDWLPRPLADMAKAVGENLTVPVDMPALMELGAVSACLCGRVSVHIRDQWTETANLYFMGVAEMGFGKSPIGKMTFAPLWKYQNEENERRKPQIAKDKGVLQAKKRKLEAAIAKGDEEEAGKFAQEVDNFQAMRRIDRFIGGDVTPERLKEIMRDNDESASIIDDDGQIFDIVKGQYSDSPNISIFINGYSGSTPAGSYRKGSDVVIERPKLTMVTMTQPSVFYEMMSNTRLVEKGLLGRFLVFKPLPITVYGTEPDMPAGVVQDYERCLQDLMKVPFKTCLRLCREAKELFFEWRLELLNKQWDEWNPIRRYGFTEKMIGNTARIAACLHMADVHKEDEVGAATMRKAIAIAQYFVGHMLHLVGTECSLTPPAKAMIEKLRNYPDGINERAFKKSFAGNTVVKGREDNALEELICLDYVRRVEAPRKGAGRPTAMLLINPNLLPQKEVIDL